MRTVDLWFRVGWNKLTFVASHLFGRTRNFIPAESLCHMNRTFLFSQLKKLVYPYPRISSDQLLCIRDSLYPVQCSCMGKQSFELTEKQWPEICSVNWTFLISKDFVRSTSLYSRFLISRSIGSLIVQKREWLIQWNPCTGKRNFDWGAVTRNLFSQLNFHVTSTKKNFTTYPNKDFTRSTSLYPKFIISRAQ